MALLRFLIIISISLTLAACDPYPKDPGHTLAQIQQLGMMQVGVLEAPPWTNQENGGGIEAEIIQEFADSLNVAIQWHDLSMHKAVKKIKEGELDLVVGGITADTPYAKEVGLTRPYLKTGDKKEDHHVMVVPRGENRFITTLEKFLAEHQNDIAAKYRGAHL